jgi:2-oxoisovalerate dehydrogenase E1 component alpha subunit
MEKIETRTYLDADGILAANCPVSIPDDILIKGLKTMLTTRLVDERMITLQRQGTITFAMSSLGEEARKKK